MLNQHSFTELRNIFEDAIDAHRRFETGGFDAIVRAADAIDAATATGRKLLAFGNGGSAADAQHLVAELVGRFEVERRALPAIALTANSSIVTAIANDYAFDRVFERQVEALGQPGDVAFGISTSGQSPNVQTAMALAKRIGLTTIALTGRDGGAMGAEADIHLNVPVTSTPRIQEVHRTVLHAICRLIEDRFRTRAR